MISITQVEKQYSELCQQGACCFCPNYMTSNLVQQHLLYGRMPVTKYHVVKSQLPKFSIGQDESLFSVIGWGDVARISFKNFSFG